MYTTSLIWGIKCTLIWDDGSQPLYEFIDILVSDKHRVWWKKMWHDDLYSNRINEFGMRIMHYLIHRNDL